MNIDLWSLFFFAWGFIFLDRSGLSYIMPSIVEDFDLSNGQVGQINMWQTIGYALFGPLVGILSDKTGKRKSILIIAIFATTFFSAVSALANSYEFLLIVRFMVGASEGPILPLAMTMVAAASAPGCFGRNAGIVNSGVAVIANTFGPVLVTQTIEFTNWHMGFVIVSIPSLILGILIWKFTEEVKTAPASTKEKASKKKGNLLEAFKYRNIVVGIFISIFCMAGLWILYSFAPLYLTTVGQYSTGTMGVIMSAMGLVGILTAIIVPLFSDYFGRRTALIFFAFLTFLAPVGLLIFPGAWLGSGMLIIFGAIVGSLAPIFMNIIPEETVPPHLIATSSALVIGLGEIIGSFILGGAGNISDTFGLSFVMIVAAGALLIMALLGFTLTETNKRKKQKPLNSSQTQQHEAMESSN